LKKKNERTEVKSKGGTSSGAAAAGFRVEEYASKKLKNGV
jgi:hypothetical protein